LEFSLQAARVHEQPTLPEPTPGPSPFLFLLLFAAFRKPQAGRPFSRYGLLKKYEQGVKEEKRFWRVEFNRPDAIAPSDENL
jgi:hypothetical protein